MTYPWQREHYADWSRGRLTHEQAAKLAETEWDNVFRVDRSDARRGASVEGKDVVRQWRVSLHSSTGPVHWITELEDGSVVLK